jgi:hypothetical protein
MTRDEALLRRMAEATADEKESSEDREAYQVRDGITSSIDPTDFRERATDEHEGGRMAESSFDSPVSDPKLDQPPRLPESGDVSGVGPDGSSLATRGTFTSPTGATIGGSTLSDDVEARGADFGGNVRGSRLDPLGMLDARESGELGEPTDRELADAVSAHDGSHAAWGVSIGGIGYDSGGGTALGVGVGPVEVHVSQEDIDAITSYPERTIGAMEQKVQEDLAAIESAWDAVTGGDESSRPDPTGGDDVITHNAAEAAVKLNNPGVYAQPSQHGDETATAAAVARAAATNNPDKLTNYGPEGEQTVEVGANWAPPPDTIFDPPPDASASMADAGAALSGSSISSTGESDFPPLPDPPPGGEDGGGPAGPPPDGGGDS